MLSLILIRTIKATSIINVKPVDERSPNNGKNKPANIPVDPVICKRPVIFFWKSVIPNRLNSAIMVSDCKALNP